MNQYVNRNNGGVPGSVDVASTSTTISPANTGRSNLLICNDSDTTIYLALGHTAVVGKGIRLNANGGAYEINNINLFVGAVNGIHATAGSLKRVCVQEG